VTCPKDEIEEPRGTRFPRSTPPGRDIETLDALARTWLTVSLLDIGLKDFEPWLETLAGAELDATGKHLGRRESASWIANDYATTIRSVVLRHVSTRLTGLQC
jgi:hypothetical protein